VDAAFNLSSRPGSRFKLVLDFDGNSLQGNAWNTAQGVSKIVTGPYDKDGDPKTFNAEEIAGVQPVRGVLRTWLGWLTVAGMLPYSRSTSHAYSRVYLKLQAMAAKGCVTDTLRHMCWYGVLY
jgi:hypothetical protein